jgi:hypothetical protein
VTDEEAHLADLAAGLREHGIDPRALLAAHGPAATIDGRAKLTAREDLPEVSKRTRALARRRGYGAIDNVLARLPVTLADGRVASARIQVLTTLLAKRFAETALLAQEAGGRPDGWVTVTLAEVSKLLYKGERGGRQYERIRDLFRELMGAGVGAEFLLDKHRVEGRYSTIQAYLVTEDGSEARLHLSAALQNSTLRGDFTYQELETMHRLLLASGRSSLPVLLVHWLNSETLPWPSGWRVFAAPEGEPVDPYDRRCVAALLGLTSPKRRDVVMLIRKAAKVVEECSDLRITIRSAAGKGMWNLYAERRPTIAAPVENGVRAPDANGVRAPDAPVYERRTGDPEEDPGKDLHPIEENEDLLISSPSCSSRLVSSRLVKETGTGIAGDPGFSGTPQTLEESDPPPKAVADPATWPARPEVCTRWYLAERLNCRSREDDDCDTVALVTAAGEHTLADLAQLACDTARHESVGGVCAFAAADEWCPVWDALTDKGRKMNNYLRRKKNPITDPDAYLRSALRKAPRPDRRARLSDPARRRGVSRPPARAARRRPRRLRSQVADLAGDWRLWRVSLRHPRQAPRRLRGRRGFDSLPEVRRRAVGRRVRRRGAHVRLGGRLPSRRLSIGRA